MDLVRRIDYGSLPDWLAAIGTVGALVWAVILYRRSNREALKEGPRRVYVLPKSEPRPVNKGGKLGSVMEGEEVLFPSGGVTTRLDSQGKTNYHALRRGVLHHVLVRNGSEEVVTLVQVDLVTSREAVFKPSPTQWNYIEPNGERDVLVFVFPRTKATTIAELLNALPRVRFVDAGGRFWTHGLGQPLASRKKKKRGTPRSSPG